MELLNLHLNQLHKQPLVAKQATKTRLELTGRLKPNPIIMNHAEFYAHTVTEADISAW